MENISEFGKLLVFIREETEESMEKMAEFFGVSTAYLKSVEHGMNPIPHGWVEALIEEYGLDMYFASYIRRAANLGNSNKHSKMAVVEIGLEEF